MRRRGVERMRRYEEAMEGAIPTSRIAGSGGVEIPGLGEIRVSGSGYISQEEIRIGGSGELPGGLKIGALRAAGSLKVKGKLEIGEGQLSGSARIEGPLRAGELKAAGSLRVEGEAEGERMELSGSSTINGKVELKDSLTSEGSLKILGDVRAGNLIELKGGFDIGGDVSTKIFRAEVRRESRIGGEIKAEEVEIESRRGGRLRVEGIRGESISLEGVICEDVAGGDIYIGEGCELGRVRYRGKIEIHPKAKLRSPPERMKQES